MGPLGCWVMENVNSCAGSATHHPVRNISIQILQMREGLSSVDHRLSHHCVDSFGDRIVILHTFIYGEIFEIATLIRLAKTQPLLLRQKIILWGSLHKKGLLSSIDHTHSYGYVLSEKTEASVLHSRYITTTWLHGQRLSWRHVNSRDSVQEVVSSTSW